MPIYRIEDDHFVPVPETSFSAAGILERTDLQRRLRNDITLLSPNLMVIAEEFTSWANSNRRIDLLCLDKDACLVVVELKRSDDAGHSELQAIRYAAMVATMTFSQVVAAYAQHKQVGFDEAAAEITGFLGGEAPSEDEFGEDVKIVLVAADFSVEVTTSVLWLNDHGVEIRCVRLKPYQLADGTLLVDVQQVIPLPEAADYLTKFADKRDEQRKERGERHLLRQAFWTGLLALAKARGAPNGHRAPTIHNWIGGGKGVNINYTLRGSDIQVEIYIDRGPKEANLRTFHFLEVRRESIEAIAGPLEWEALPDVRACRIRRVLAGGYRSPKSEWPQIHEAVVDAGVLMEKAFKDHLGPAASA